MPKKSTCFCALRARMKERDMTIDDLVESIGMTRGKIGPKFQGKGKWTVEEMVAICDCLGFPPNTTLEEIKYFFREPPGGWINQQAKNNRVDFPRREAV